VSNNAILYQYSDAVFAIRRLINAKDREASYVINLAKFGVDRSQDWGLVSSKYYSFAFTREAVLNTAQCCRACCDYYNYYYLFIIILFSPIWYLVYPNDSLKHSTIWGFPSKSCLHVNLKGFTFQREWINRKMSLYIKRSNTRLSLLNHCRDLLWAGWRKRRNTVHNNLGIQLTTELNRI